MKLKDSCSLKKSNDRPRQHIKKQTLLHLQRSIHGVLTQSCPPLCDPTDYSPPGSSLSMGVLQARILKWLAILSSKGSSQPRNQIGVCCIAGGFFTR